MSTTNERCEDLEFGIQASRARFKPGAELSHQIIRRVDVKFDEHELEGKDVFTMEVKVCYVQQEAGSAE